MFTTLSLLIRRMSYAEIVDFAYDIESSKEERKDSREIGKKLKM